jgi:hypothetical protein
LVYSNFVTIVIFTFLRFTASDYLFGIFKLCDHFNICLSKNVNLRKVNITMVTKFEYTKEVIRSRKSKKGKYYNGHKV